MFDFTDVHDGLIEKYNRPIVHMRHQMEFRRFGLVIGSGFNKDFGLPTWSQLVKRIAEDSQVSGTKLLDESKDKSLPYQTELLFQHFKRRRAAELSSAEDADTKAFENTTRYEWLRIVAKHLYVNAPQDVVPKVVNHSYMKSYLPIVRETLMTVTYNFDDYLERALAATRTAERDGQTRGYETVTNPWVQFRKNYAVIYHPNGIYPAKPMEEPVDKFIFSEASYAEQFAGIFAGEQYALINHFSKNTCLLIGLSLEDEMLRNLLILSARASPGNYHYYVRLADNTDSLDEDMRKTIRRTNFDLYNLVTLFLNKEEIAGLGELIDAKKVSDDKICDAADRKGKQCAYRFYLTGAMGVGKSTTLNNLRSLHALDEWLEERPEILAKPWDELNGEEREEADAWLMGQFEKKNETLRNSRPGIFVVDRPPLDPLAFTKPKDRPAKAARLLTAICPGKASWRVEEGTVICLVGDSKEMAVRLLLTGRTRYIPEKIDEMEATLKEIYAADGVVTVDTYGLTIPEVTKRVAEIIHLRKYRPCDLHTRLNQFGKDQAEAEA